MAEMRKGSISIGKGNVGGMGGRREMNKKF